jgi:hypothetical protein
MDDPGKGAAFPSLPELRGGYCPVRVAIPNVSGQARGEYVRWPGSH